MLKIKFLVMAIAISFTGIISSCYYDYGIDPDTSNVVVTAYNNTYNFQNVSTFYLDDSVYQVGGSNIANPYESNIINTTRSNLLALGWTETTDTALADVYVSTGVTTSTYTVDSYDYWWYGGGYSWYYPPYYSYSYSYTTGTVAILIAEPDLATTDQLPIEWSGVLNGVTGQANPGGLITTGINQAFSQSPYLKKN